MRFTIRDLLWLTLLAAVLVAWWVDRGALAERLKPYEQSAKYERALLEELRKQNAQFGTVGVDALTRSPSPAPQSPP